MEYSNLLGLNIVCAEQSALLDQVSQWLASFHDPGKLHTLSYVNAHCLNLAYQDRGYFQALQNFDLIYPDGVGAAWAGRWLTGKKMYKMTGADWLIPFCALAQTNNWRIYILGGKAGVALQAAENLCQQFPQLKIVGTHDGYFTETQLDDILSEIITLSPDVLFVGLGVPKQELWINQWKTGLPVKVIWAVGALFDYAAGREARAPLWMRNHALEWAWRMWVDPVGKWKRYLLGNPLFFIRIVIQKIKRNRSAPKGFSP